MTWNYRPYTWYRCMKRGNRTEYTKEQEFAVTIDIACTIHCAKRSHILRHFSHWFLSRLCRRWGALCECSTVSQCHSVTVTCHTSLRTCITHNPCFRPHFGQFSHSTHRWQAYWLPFKVCLESIIEKMTTTENELVTYKAYMLYISKLLCGYLNHPTYAHYSATAKERGTVTKFTNIFFKGSGGNI